jgi:uncharacterized protein YqeY
MTLKDRLNDDLRAALRARDEVRKSTLRLLLSAVHNAEIEAGRQLDDAGVTASVAREVRQRRESVEEYGKAGRADLVARESAELDILITYLPPQLSREEIVAAARRIIAEVAAQGPADKGKVMPRIIAELRGKAEGGEINAVVTELLARGPA